MRIATLQLKPRLGDIQSNIRRADDLLAAHFESDPGPIDLLVLSELALTGYNFPSFEAIRPHLEPTGRGSSSIWAKKTAAKYKCIISVGYPELKRDSVEAEVELKINDQNAGNADDTHGKSLTNGAISPPGQEEQPNGQPTSPPRQLQEQEERPTAYNSTITVSPAGAILAHYRKTHLYYTDETWAKEGPAGFTTTDLVFPSRDNVQGECQPSKTIAVELNGTLFPPLSQAPETKLQNGDEKSRIGRKRIAWGICMDLNPHRFVAPWDAYEFCSAAIASAADTIVVSTAWLTSLSPLQLAEEPESPDWDTFTYWINRLLPLVRDGERETLVVCANRCGEEPGANPIGQGEDGVRYAGSSWIGVVGKGKVSVWGIMGRAEEGVLVADVESDKPRCRFEVRQRVDEEESEDDTDQEAERKADAGERPAE